jgi:hypothetical protein
MDGRHKAGHDEFESLFLLRASAAPRESFFSSTTARERFAFGEKPYSTPFIRFFISSIFLTTPAECH